MFGIGGGLVFLPALLFILPQIGVDNDLVTLSAIATSLYAGVFSSSSSFINHFIKKNVSIEHGLILGAGCLISASIVPRLIIHFNPIFLKYLISFFLLSVAAILFFSKNERWKSNKQLNKKVLFLVGIIFGGIGSLIGFGGGIFYVPFLIYFFKGDTKMAVGTSTPAVILTMLSAVLSFLVLDQNWVPNIYQFGYINLLIGTLLGIGAVIGAWIGVKFMHKISNTVFKRLFSLFLIISILKLLLG